MRVLGRYSDETHGRNERLTTVSATFDDALPGLTALVPAASADSPD